MLDVGQLLRAVEVIHHRAHTEVVEKLAMQELQHPSASKNHLQRLPMPAAEIVRSFLGPPRGFEESIELQTATWGMRRQTRGFRLKVVLPFESSSKELRVRVLASATDIELQQEAEACGAEFFEADRIGAQLHKDRKVIKKWAQAHDGTGHTYKFYASTYTLKRIPRIFGPQLMRMGAFPEVVRPGELARAVAAARREASFKLRPYRENPMGFSAAVGHVGLQMEDAFINVAICINALYRQLEDCRANVKFGHPFQTIAVKTTMGKPVYLVRHGLRELRPW